MNAKNSPVELFNIVPVQWIARYHGEWFRVPAVHHGWDQRVKIATPAPAVIRHYERGNQVASFYGIGLNLPME